MWRNQQQQQHQQGYFYEQSNYGDPPSYYDNGYGDMSYAPSDYQYNSYAPPCNYEWDRPQDFGCQRQWEDPSPPKNVENLKDGVSSTLKDQLDRMMAQINGLVEQNNDHNQEPPHNPDVGYQWQDQGQQDSYSTPPTQYQHESMSISSTIESQLALMTEELARAVDRSRIIVEEFTLSEFSSAHQMTQVDEIEDEVETEVAESEYSADAMGDWSEKDVFEHERETQQDEPTLQDAKSKEGFHCKGILEQRIL